MRVEAGSPHIISAPPFSLGGGHLALFPCSSVGSSHGRQSSMNFSSVSSSQGRSSSRDDPTLIPLTGCRLSRSHCCSAGPPLAHESCLPKCPAQAAHRSAASFGHPPALARDRGCTGSLHPCSAHEL